MITKKCIVLLLSAFFVTSAKADFLTFRPEDGYLASDLTIQRLTDVNIVPTQFIPEFPQYHLFNIALTLQKNGCFQEANFYDKGNKSKFSKALTTQQAMNFLATEYSERVDIWPHEKLATNIDLIVLGGVNANMKKLLFSVEQLTANGYAHNNIYCIVQNKTMQQDVARMIDASTIANKETVVKYIVADHDLGWVDVGLTKLHTAGCLADNYIIVVTEATVDVAKTRVMDVFGDDHHCAGVVCLPAKDWHTDLCTYQYDEIYKDYHQAAIAWASNLWNIIARGLWTKANKLAKTTGVNLSID